MSAARMRRRIAGKLGRGGGPPWVGGAGLFPPEPQMLEESESELARKRVVVQTAPAPALEMVEARFLLHPLVHLLADPAGLDRRGRDLEWRVARQVGRIIFPLTAGAMLADDPELLASPGRCGPLAAIGPAATRTRTAANAALSGPLVPVRRAMVRNVSGRASISAAAPTPATEGTGCLRGRPVALRAG